MALPPNLTISGGTQTSKERIVHYSTSNLLISAIFAVIFLFLVECIAPYTKMSTNPHFRVQF